MKIDIDESTIINSKIRDGWKRHHPFTLQAVPRWKEIIQMRDEERMTFRDIGQHFGFTGRNAYRLYKTANKKLQTKAPLSRGD